MVNRFSRVRLCATLWTVACQALLSVGFSRQENWSGLPCPLPRDLPNPESYSCIGGRFPTTGATWEALKLGTPILLTAVNLACQVSMEENQKSAIEKFLFLPQLALSW